MYTRKTHQCDVMEVLEEGLGDGPPHPLEPLLDRRLAPDILEVGGGGGRGSLPPDHHHGLLGLLDGGHGVVGADGGHGGGQGAGLQVDTVVWNPLVTSVGIIKPWTVNLITVVLILKE